MENLFWNDQCLRFSILSDRQSETVVRTKLHQLSLGHALPGISSNFMFPNAKECTPVHLSTIYQRSKCDIFLWTYSQLTIILSYVQRHLETYFIPDYFVRASLNVDSLFNFIHAQNYSKQYRELIENNKLSTFEKTFAEMLHFVVKFNILTEICVFLFTHIT